MNAVVSLPSWLRIRRKPLPPSPIPKAAAETKRVADEVARFADQLRRENDQREARQR